MPVPWCYITSASQRSILKDVFISEFVGTAKRRRREGMTQLYCLWSRDRSLQSETGTLTRLLLALPPLPGNIELVFRLTPTSPRRPSTLTFDIRHTFSTNVCLSNIQDEGYRATHVLTPDAHSVNASRTFLSTMIRSTVCRISILAVTTRRLPTA